MKVGVIGLGRMGSAIAGQLAKKGLKVKGYDIAERRI
jgi:3-hydroxyisobutyrate dehydrogenase-like beta-hydroxyacid dehydrogenase